MITLGVKIFDHDTQHARREKHARERWVRCRVNLVGSISHLGGQARIVSAETLAAGRFSAEAWSIDMPSAPFRTSASPVAPGGDIDLSARLALKPSAPPTGYVDGAWWPRSRDLSSELPAILALLAARLGPIERVSYHLGDWRDPTPRKIVIVGSNVHLSGYRTQPADTIDVLARTRRVTLLVIPPQASPETAQHALTTAAQHRNTASIELLLTPSATIPPDQRAIAMRATDPLSGPPLALVMGHAASSETVRTAGAEQALWETDGGAGDNRANDSTSG